jgi:hypothetical protein
LGIFSGRDGVETGFKSYPHFFHSGIFLSAFVNLANRHILSRGKCEKVAKKHLTFP